MTLNFEYPTPLSEDLIPLWESYSEEPAKALKGVLGVFSAPKTKITDIISLDLCEVVRESSQALHDATGVPLDDSGAFYQQGTWYAPEVVGREFERSITVSILQVLINNHLVHPVQYISGISSIVRNWRNSGAFVVANTSTLPGCEPGTISHTLQKTLPGCFDGIVFPRGYDNDGEITKNQALAIICAEAGVDYEKLPIMHIDDSNGHHGAFRSASSDRSDVTLLAPIAKGREAPDAHYQFKTPIEAFMHADMLRVGRVAS